MNAHLRIGLVEQCSRLFAFCKAGTSQSEDKLGHNNKMSEKLLSPASFGEAPLMKCSVLTAHDDSISMCFLD